MIFKDTFNQVLSGHKTVTRRIVKEGEFLNGPAVQNRQNAIKWQTGRYYAVQPGRMKKGLGKIKITAIRKERLGDITGSDAARELGWDLTKQDELNEQMALAAFQELWDKIHTTKGQRWDDDPEVWVIDFFLWAGPAYGMAY